MRPRARQRPSAIGRSIPAPVGGWNTQAPISAMPITDALILDNWVTRPGYVEIRRGFYPQQTAAAVASAETLMTYRGSSAGDKLYACAGGKIYDVTTQGAVLGAAVLSGLASNRWQYLNFANAAGRWLIAYNGSDTPISFDGTTWAAMVITGSSGSITLTPSTLFTAAIHKGRILALEKNSLHCWFPAAGAIQGAYSLLDLGSVFSMGGSLVSVGSWSWPGLSPDSYVSFVTDQGQVAVYQGIDPASSSSWSLIGVFNVGKPLGPRALIRYGSDLMVMTTDGVIAMSKVLQNDRSEAANASITGKIDSAFATAVRAYKSNFGWQGIYYPGNTTSATTSASAGGLAIFNIPTANLTTAMQFVQNTQTGSWSRFTGLNAICWETANDQIYFSSPAGVFQWDYGSSDNGAAITNDLKGAFSNYGSANTKQFTMARPLLNTIDVVQPALDMNVDYQDSAPTATAVIVPNGGTAAAMRYDWTSLAGVGYVGALRMQISMQGTPATDSLAYDPALDLLLLSAGTDTLLLRSSTPFDIPCQLYGFDLMYQSGGAL
jgi:hypothetical protein